MRPAFLAAAARPFLRSPSTAFSRSPWASVKAALQSIIGAPVRSRNCLTICAVTSMTRSLLWGAAGRGRRAVHADKRKGQIDAGSTDLFATRPAAFGRPAPMMVACRPLGRGRAARAARATRSCRGAILVENRHGHPAAGAAGTAVLLLDHHLLFELPRAFDVGVGDARREQPDGADGVVVARDDVVDQLRIAVGVDHRD